MPSRTLISAFLFFLSPGRRMASNPSARGTDLISFHLFHSLHIFPLGIKLSMLKARRNVPRRLALGYRHKSNPHDVRGTADNAGEHFHRQCQGITLGPSQEAPLLPRPFGISSGFTVSIDCPAFRYWAAFLSSQDNISLATLLEDISTITGVSAVGKPKEMGLVPK